MSVQQDDYQDIIHLPRHVSPTHPPMSMENRAAQFSAFAALSGYEDAVRETGRLTQERIELSEEEQMVLDYELGQALEQGCEVEVTWFVPDEHKEGGSYQSVRGYLKKADVQAGILKMRDGTRIPVEQVVGMERIGDGDSEDT